MALTRTAVVDAAMALLDEYGLESLSMRRLATALEVQPGALYWHVRSKQDLLSSIAERIVAEVADDVEAPSEGGPGSRGPGAGARATAIAFREALLAHRNGAEIVTLAQALADAPLPVRRRLDTQLREVLDPEQAAWTARAMSHYVLGAASEAQSRADLTRAGILDGTDGEEDLRAFLFGLDALLAGALSGAG